ncbi:EF-hand domain-containing protein [Streptomyces sp. ISL-11]|uniref:EF-hand domain-containing protein n=1 Tax=Streptomyces sp. ISL-11 TaxID=2819174 RepID=UPI001BE749CB|nr:EF-hand domain-containing protein [Streptomyces sp. ISL-11]MBT2387291.1 EF-hand domain-containing protein [Streptomyces sp. ISL-11]
MSTDVPHQLTFQQRKAAAQFHALDTNGNGYLERDGYDAIVDRVLAEFSVDPGSPSARNLRQQYLTLFDRLLERMDRDGDGRISEAEFLASVGASVTKSHGKAMRPVAHAVFTNADRDHDDHLSAEEFRRLLAVMDAPMDEEAIEQVLVDGRLNREGFAQLIEGYYGSPDASAPGSRLFGPVRS